MSRIARKPLPIPTGVNVELNGSHLKVKGKKGEFDTQVHPAVEIKIVDKMIEVKAKNKAHPMVGTTRKMLDNMVKGVNDGFERKLSLVGVGYRAKVQGSALELSLGFSHPVQYHIPKGITIETPTNTEIVIKGSDRERIGKIAADIRAVRPPEPYKGKGVRYFDEKIELKETKKK